MNEKAKPPISRSVAVLARITAVLLLVWTTILVCPVPGAGIFGYYLAMIMTVLYIPATSHPKNANAWRVFFFLAIPVAAIVAMGVTGQAHQYVLRVLIDVPALLHFFVPVLGWALVSLVARLTSRKTDVDG